MKYCLKILTIVLCIVVQVMTKVCECSGRFLVCTDTEYSSIFCNNSLFEVNFTNSIIRDFQIFDNITTDKLILTNNSITSIDGLIKIPNLKIIYLDHNNIKHITKKSLENVNLTYISIESNGLQDIDSDAFENIFKLKYLYLQNNEIYDIAFLNNLTKLERLNLCNNKITNISQMHKYNLINLKYLDLSQNLIKSIETSFLQSFISLSNIKLNNNSICSIRMSGMTTDIFINLEFNNISEIGSLKTIDNFYNYKPKVRLKGNPLLCDFVELLYRRNISSNTFGNRSSYSSTHQVFGVPCEDHIIECQEKINHNPKSIPENDQENTGEKQEKNNNVENNSILLVLTVGIAIIIISIIIIIGLVFYKRCRSRRKNNSNQEAQEDKIGNFSSRNLPPLPGEDETGYMLPIVNRHSSIYEEID